MPRLNFLGPHILQAREALTAPRGRVFYVLLCVSLTAWLYVLLPIRRLASLKPATTSESHHFSILSLCSCKPMSKLTLLRRGDY